jgi:hypothetical protein
MVGLRSLLVKLVQLEGETVVGCQRMPRLQQQSPTCGCFESVEIVYGDAFKDQIRQRLDLLITARAACGSLCVVWLAACRAAV